MSGVRAISYKAIRDFAATHADAKRPLDDWFEVAAAADWQSIADVRRDFPHADTVQVASGNTVTVFNIKGNRYRLVTAIKYHWGIVYLLMIMTHAEYSKGKWKEQL